MSLQKWLALDKLQNFQKILQQNGGIRGFMYKLYRSVLWRQCQNYLMLWLWDDLNFILQTRWCEMGRTCGRRQIRKQILSEQHLFLWYVWLLAVSGYCFDESVSISYRLRELGLSLASAILHSEKLCFSLFRNFWPLVSTAVLVIHMFVVLGTLVQNR